MWTLVLLADFILEFRLEYLWPCWLFFGSVYTTFHCHGLVALCFLTILYRKISSHCVFYWRHFLFLQVICVVFVCAAFTLDIFCLIFVPLHWLFFVASTYVLFNYIWHSGEWMNHLDSFTPTDASWIHGRLRKMQQFSKESFFNLCFVEKGVCISTVSLWILLVYTEASLRLKDLKTSYANLSHLFAAHWYIYWHNYSNLISCTSYTNWIFINSTVSWAKSGQLKKY